MAVAIFAALAAISLCGCALVFLDDLIGEPE